MNRPYSAIAFLVVSCLLMCVIYIPLLLAEPIPERQEERVSVEHITIVTTENTPLTDEVTTEVPTTEPVTEVTTKQSTHYEYSDIELIALITMAEAEGESELDKRLVIDTILNRVDSEYFPDTVYGVIYQPGQFSPTWNGRLSRCYVREDICQLVREEMESRTNSEVLYFRTDHYFDFGTPVIQEGNSYFSTM